GFSSVAGESVPRGWISATVGQGVEPGVEEGGDVVGVHGEVAVEVAGEAATGQAAEPGVEKSGDNVSVNKLSVVPVGRAGGLRRAAEASHAGAGDAVHRDETAEGVQRGVPGAVVVGDEVR